MSDTLGASDVWLMFSLFMGANGHMVAAGCALLVCVMYCVVPDKKPAGVSTP